MKRILYAKPSITEKEVAYVTDAITNGWGEKCYDYIYRFENSFRQYLSVPYALATSSCTGAIHIALAAIGIKPGDEVIVPDITWAASVVPISYLGAKPVFVDVLETTWCINPEKIEAAITPKTKAIIAVHLYGNLAEMDDIMQIARKYNLIVIEDAAEALGSEYKGKKAGSIADFGVFSFHGTKTVTTGEGGMLVANNAELFEKARILWDHGRNPKTGKMFWVEEVGYKYKMSNLQAALGTAQMDRVEELVASKRTIFAQYKKAFGNIAGIQLNEEQNYAKNSYWMPTLVFAPELGINRDDLIRTMKAMNIDIRNFFYPVSMFPMFQSVRENVVAYDIYNRGINLPSYFDLESSEIEKVIELINKLIQKQIIYYGS